LSIIKRIVYYELIIFIQCDSIQRPTNDSFILAARNITASIREYIKLTCAYGSLDKEFTSYNDIVDAFRVA
jgi:hypothetical protein